MMSDYISLSQAAAHFAHFAADMDQSDRCAMSEAWNDYTDSLVKTGKLSPLQYQYCPAYGDVMPGEGSRFDPLADDRKFIVDRMGFTMSARFVPFSLSRNAKGPRPSLNWIVTIKRNGQEVFTADYSQGVAHCPAYSKTLSCTAYSRYNADQWKKLMVDMECETGKRAIFKGAHIREGAPIDPPDIVDVLYALLMETEGYDNARNFEEWAADYGFDADSRKAYAVYQSISEQAKAIRASMMGSELAELTELFRGM